MVMTQPSTSTMRWKLMQPEAAVSQAKEIEGYRNHQGVGITSTANVDFAQGYLKSFFTLKYNKIQSNEAWDTHKCGAGKSSGTRPKIFGKVVIKHK